MIEDEENKPAEAPETTTEAVPAPDVPAEETETETPGEAA